MAARAAAAKAAATAAAAVTEVEGTAVVVREAVQTAAERVVVPTAVVSMVEDEMVGEAKALAT